MKKYLTIIALAILLLFTSTTAQVLQKFEASEGVATAKNVLSSKTNVELVFVGTILKTIQYQTMSIPIEFDFNSGLSNAWIYGFKSGPNQDSLNFVAVVKLFSFMAFDASAFASTMEINFQSTLEGQQWKKSNEMIELFKASTEFMDFLNSHPNRENSIISLESNKNIPFIPQNQPFWIIYIDADPIGKICAVDAISGGQVICSLTDVAEQQNSITYQNVFPNPANTLVNVIIPNDCNNNNTKFELYNQLGVLVNQNELFSFDFSSSILKINTSGLEQGIYLLRMINSKAIYISKLIINR